MQIEEMERLVLLVRDSGVRELTLRQGDARVTIRQSVGTPLVQDWEEGEWQSEPDIVTEGEEDSYAPEPSVVSVSASVVGFFRHVKPMVGVGAEVKVGKTIGVIESMKIVNEIKATVEGTVLEVLVEDGMPVEFGQALYVIQPTE
jgi:biotin carboxyl carrier protein